jgi:uncharacterized RDD family membrane protein YckC
MNQENPEIDKQYIENLQKFGSDHYGRYSTFWDRVLAGLADGLVLMVPLGFIAYYSPPDSMVAFYVTVFLPYAYSIILHGMYGRTLGKRLLGLKVIDKSESREIGFRQAFIREAVPLVSVALLLIGAGWGLKEEHVDPISTIWYLVEVFSTLSNPKRRAAHDFIAGTVVVKA